MKLNGKRILVTGSRGFVGKNLVAELKRHGAEVLTLTDNEGRGIDIRDQERFMRIIIDISITQLCSECGHQTIYIATGYR